LRASLAHAVFRDRRHHVAHHIPHFCPRVAVANTLLAVTALSPSLGDYCYCYYYSCYCRCRCRCRCCCRSLLISP
jgi:hypothetical protein